MTVRVLERLRSPVTVPLADLTPQERRILDLITEGMTNRQIGEAMFLAEKTVKNYVSHLRRRWASSAGPRPRPTRQRSPSPGGLMNEPTERGR